MTESGHMDALTALLEERKQYESWIAQLDARRGNAPGHVLERVRGDYVTRLGQVTEQLVQRAPELRSSAHELAVRLAALERDEEEKRDERAEYELRAAVGEYSSDAAQETFARCDEAIARFAGERQVIETELTRVRGVLAAIDIAAAQLNAPAAHVNYAAPSAPAPAPVRAPTHAYGSEPAAAPQQPDDELAFLKSVVADQRLTPAIAAPPAAPNEAEAQPSPAYLGGRRSMTAEEALPVAMAPNSGTVPSVLKDVPSEQVKTLRCQECGTLNYPTEWYCERCGGELAAM
jgi:hypothetical protein